MPGCEALKLPRPKLLLGKNRILGGRWRGAHEKSHSRLKTVRKLEQQAAAKLPGGEVNPGRYYTLGAFNQRLLETCARHNWICFDAASIRFEKGDFYDDVHTTPSGSAKIGQFAAQQWLQRF